MSSGIFLPVELALAQALQESSMGINGRSPKTNPFNIGEYDTHTQMRFKSTYDGVEAYYRYMTKTYLKCKAVDLLLKDFTNCKNNRYAHKGYGEIIGGHYRKIKKYLDGEMNKYAKNK
jgi:hypothetical protein